MKQSVEIVAVAFDKKQYGEPFPEAIIRVGGVYYLVHPSTRDARFTPVAVCTLGKRLSDGFIENPQRWTANMDYSDAWRRFYLHPTLRPLFIKIAAITQELSDDD